MNLNWGAIAIAAIIVGAIAYYMRKQAEKKDNQKEPVHKDPIEGTAFTFASLSSNYKGTPKTPNVVSGTSDDTKSAATVLDTEDTLQYEMTQGNIDAIMSFYADEISGNNGTSFNKADMTARLQSMVAAGFIPFVSFEYSDITTTTNADGTTTSTCLLTAQSGVDTTGQFSGTAGQAINFTQWKSTSMEYNADVDKWLIYEEINTQDPNQSTTPVQ